MSEQTTARTPKSSVFSWLRTGIDAGVVILLLVIVGAVGAMAWFFFNRLSDPALRDGRVVLVVNQNSGRCLSVKEGATTGTHVTQGPTPDQAGPSERWILRRVSKGVFRLVHEQTQLVAQIPEGHMARGAKVILSEDATTLPNQHWGFERLPAGYVLRVQQSQLVLAIGQGSLENGVKAIQWEHLKGVKDQHWDLQDPAK